jgi:hypothetical protein
MWEEIEAGATGLAARQTTHLEAVDPITTGKEVVDNSVVSATTIFIGPNNYKQGTICRIGLVLGFLRLVL